MRIRHTRPRQTDRANDPARNSQTAGSGGSFLATCQDVSASCTRALAPFLRFSELLFPRIEQLPTLLHARLCLPFQLLHNPVVRWRWRRPPYRRHAVPPDRSDIERRRVGVGAFLTQSHSRDPSTIECHAMTARGALECCVAVHLLTGAAVGGVKLIVTGSNASTGFPFARAGLYFQPSAALSA